MTIMKMALVERPSNGNTMTTKMMTMAEKLTPPGNGTAVHVTTSEKADPRLFVADVVLAAMSPESDGDGDDNDDAIKN